MDADEHSWVGFVAVVHMKAFSKVQARQRDSGGRERVAETSKWNRVMMRSGATDDYYVLHLLLLASAEIFSVVVVVEMAEYRLSPVNWSRVLVM